jgi:hypothetical protein
MMHPYMLRRQKQESTFTIPVAIASVNDSTSSTTKAVIVKEKSACGQLALARIHIRRVGADNRYHSEDRISGLKIAETRLYFA